MKASLFPLLLAAGAAQAGVAVDVCYNYGCQTETRVRYDARQLGFVRDLLRRAHDAAEEREHLALALGSLYRWAGEQSPIHVDKGGDYADDGVYGRMDCIDHATTTTRLLRMIEAQGWLRHHRVLEPARRTFFILQHFSAVIEAHAVPVAEHAAPEARWAIDTWFRDNGAPAVVMPLDIWRRGAYPDDWRG